MLIAMIAAIVAVAVAVIRGGSLDNLARTEFRWLPYLFVGLAIQIAYEWLPLEGLDKTKAAVVVVGSFVLVGAFLASNHRLPGMVVAAFGVVLNIAVISSNGAMPVSARAAELAGLSPPPPDAVKHELLTDETVLPWLGDVIPVPLLEEVISPGDVVLAFGIATLVYTRARARDGMPSEVAG